MLEGWATVERRWRTRDGVGGKEVGDDGTELSQEGGWQARGWKRGVCSGR